MFDQEFADKKPSPTTRYADFVVSGLGPDDSVDGQATIKDIAAAKAEAMAASLSAEVFGA